MKPSINEHPTVAPNQPKRRLHRRRASRRPAVRVFLSLLTIFMIGFVGSLVLAFATPFGKRARLLLAETVISSRHSGLARYLVSAKEYSLLWSQINARVFNTGISGKIHVLDGNSSNAIEIQKISGSTYNGYVMFVHNPRLIRLVRANVHNSMGEYITDMSRRVGAVAGTNASGFEDPNGGGWGGLPVGLEYVNQTVVNPIKNTESWTTVGFTSGGVMVMGQYSLPELQQLGVRDAMQFHPELVFDGKPMITYGDGGWGYGPRTAIGQEQNGTVIFLVINGRFHGGSGPGASQRQVMDLMMSYGAVNACAMDGGSSSVLDSQGQILNSPSTIDPMHERHLPDAWLVFPSAQAANQYAG